MAESITQQTRRFGLRLLLQLQLETCGYFYNWETTYEILSPRRQ